MVEQRTQSARSIEAEAVKMILKHCRDPLVEGSNPSGGAKRVCRPLRDYSPTTLSGDRSIITRVCGYLHTSGSNRPFEA